MRRNAGENGETTMGGNPGKQDRLWRRKGKSREIPLPEEEFSWEKTSAMSTVLDPSARRDPVPGDEGDAGIGRPFNVEVRPIESVNPVSSWPA